ncbi:hypothetical protein OY671_010310, partial [Metschnikowia pulcherrima]
LAGVDDAAARGAAVYAFEKTSATAHWDRIKSRDSDSTYNKWSAADFAAKAPGFPWEVYMKTAGTAGQGNYSVGMPSALTDEAKAFADAPVQVVQDFRISRLSRSSAGGTVSSGAPQQPVRWKRGVGIVSGAMGEQVGQEYVAQYFPPATKAAADQLVKNIIAAMSV